MIQTVNTKGIAIVKDLISSYSNNTVFSVLFTLEENPL